MALSVKPSNLCRSLYITSRCYCQQPAKDQRSLYQRDEDGPQERTVYGKPYPDWRKPWIQRKGEWSSKFSLFVEKNPNPDILGAMSRIPDLTVEKVKDWWKNMKELQEIDNQKYLSARTDQLGSNLAAAHFFSFRGAAIRFQNSNWIAGPEEGQKLPDRFKEGYFVEAIDCTNFHRGGIRYEGLLNLMDLNFLKWLSLKNNTFVDVWCLDRIAGLNGSSLEYLDISGCNFNLGCINALARMKVLKCLVLTDPGMDAQLQAGLSMLENENPGLLIKAVDSTNVAVKQ